MTEEQVFLAALDISDRGSRTAFLDGACAGNHALRCQVEALLAAHERSGEFLKVPAMEQMEARRGGDVTATIHPNVKQDEVLANDKKAPDDDEAIHFLTLSQRPDSLGRIGHYEVLEVLGKGGFGIVFRAFDDVLQRVVAVKVMAPQLAATSPARKRFLREARSSAQVRHENVVQVYEIGEQPLPYLAMEFIPGETLQQRLDRTGPLDSLEVVRIGRQIAEGLAAAHATELIHRDIKPSNILIEGGHDKAKLTDFGLARAADDASISQSGIIAGTPMFMAPEQALGAKLDQRADLFSLGSVLYQMAAGRPPFRANSTVAVLKRVAEDAPRDIREIIPETPQWLCNIIAKLHAKNPDERYQTAREVADVLAACEQQLRVHGTLKDFSRIPGGRPPSRRPRRRALAAAALVLLLPIIAWGVYALTRPPTILNNGSATPPVQPAPDADGWVQLFNGRDLTGWNTHPDHPGDWVVQNGLLVGRSGQVGYLFSDRDDFENFQLRAEVKLNSGGDSGLFIRAQAGPLLDSLNPAYPFKKGPPGYEVQVSQDSPSRTGSLMLVQDGKEPGLFREERVLAPPDQWCVLEITADGPWLRLKVNGEQTAYLKNEAFARGHIALQMWNNTTTVEFRKIEIKELQPTTPQVPNSAADVLPIQEGNWKLDRYIVEPKVAPGLERTSGHAKFDFVGGGKILRGRLTFDRGLREVHVVQSFDPKTNRPLCWFLASDGRANGPGLGVFDTEKRSLLWLEQLPDGAQSVQHFEFTDANTIRTRCYQQDRENRISFEMRMTLTRTQEPIFETMVPKDPMRPNEMNVLDRLIGEWHNEVKVKTADAPDKEKTESMRTTAESILAGRFIEIIERNETTNRSDYSLLWFDAERKQYRQWAFIGTGQVHELTGTWSEEQKTLRWVAPGGLEGHWTFQNENQSEFERKVVGADGTLLMEARGVARRVASTPLSRTFKNGIGMEFVKVPKGRSWLGGGKDKLGDKEVVIQADFYLGKYEVTQEEWEKLMGANPSCFSRAGTGADNVEGVPDAELKRFPVEEVTLEKCRELVAKLNRREKHSGWIYRLPTEIEWEYACRSGPMSDIKESAFDYYLSHPTNTLLPTLANCDQTLKRTCKVGSYAPNRLGLYDMHGNVWEWCETRQTMPNGQRSINWRGGCWNDEASMERCRAGSRWSDPIAPTDHHFALGLRLALVRSDAPAPEVKMPPVAVAPFDAAKAREFQEAWAKRLDVLVETTNSLGMKFRLIPPGAFTMGNSDENPFAVPEDKPQHRVQITRPYLLGVHEVTVGQFREFVTATKTKTYAETDPRGAQIADEKGYYRVPGTNWLTPGFLQTDDHPVTCVTWADANAFCEWLSKKEGVTYRLPTDAEWEYACRGGTATAYYYGPKADPKMAAMQRWGKDSGTVPVGSFPANPFGLHDMLGNVYEWCHDGRREYTAEPATDPRGPTGPTDKRVRRGGAWSSALDQKSGALSGGRYAGPPDDDAAHTIGFRVVRVGDLKPKTPPVIAPFTDADVQRIAALPAEQQVEEVRKELMRRNPGFDGTLTPTVEDGVVTGLKFSTALLDDITSVRALTGLTSLDCRGSFANQGKLSDLAPLKGLSLTSVDLSFTQVRDLGPLRGMPLTMLSLGYSQVRDLTPLKGMKLETLQAQAIPASDLSPLEGMPLKNLDLHRAVGVTDLRPLRGMPLVYLNLSHLSVSDLSTLGGVKSLDRLALHDMEQLSDLKPLEGLRLTELDLLRTRVTDLSPLKGMELKQVVLPPVNGITRGLDILRGMKSLATILVDHGTKWPAAEFWERYDKGEFKK